MSADSQEHGADTLCEKPCPALAQGALSGTHAVGREALRQAQGHLSARHASTLILKVWEDRTATSVDNAKIAIARVISEYLAGGDLAEAARSIQALHVPFFSHELVKKALTAAIEVEKPPAEEARRCCGHAQSLRYAAGARLSICSSCHL